MVSLLSQYVIFNGFLRNIFSFIFLTQRKMAELYSDYDTYTILFFSVCFKRLDFQSSVLHEDNKIEGKSSESKCFVCYLFGVVQQKTGLFQMFVLYNLHLCALGLVYLKAFFFYTGERCFVLTTLDVCTCLFSITHRRLKILFLQGNLKTKQIFYWGILTSNWWKCFLYLVHILCVCYIIKPTYHSFKICWLMIFLSYSETKSASMFPWVSH